MKHKKTRVALAISVMLGGYVTTQAATLNLTSLVITSGAFAQGVFTPVPNPITHFGEQNLVAGSVPATWNTTIGPFGPQPGAIMAWDYNAGGNWLRQ